MPKAAYCFIFVCLFTAAATAAQPTRPRLAATPPPSIADTPSRDQKRPPVLQDNSIVPPSPTAVPKTQQPDGDDVISVETNLVTTAVSVLDRSGRFIAGLKERDFRIFDNGVPQKVAWFQSEEQPFTIVLMIDTSPSTQYHIDQIHHAAAVFVNQLRPRDKVMVVAFDHRFRILAEPTSDREALYEAIYRSQFGRGTSLYDAIDRVANLDMINATGRKAVVLFTDGVDTTSRFADLESTIAATDETDALFYPIRYDTQDRFGIDAILAGFPIQVPPEVIWRIRRRSVAQYEKGQSYLRTLAENSGGRMFEADTITNLEASFSGIAEELRRQYSVGYYPEVSGEPGERRRIKIEVAKAPKAVIRSKTSYLVREKQESKPEVPAGGVPASR